MGFELPNGKTARNIQEQVKFLTEKLKDLYSRVNDLEIHIEVVEELPETGVEGTIYLLPASDPEEGNYYEEYIWLDDAWELIGTTQVDLSQYYTKTEADQKFVTLATEQDIIGSKTYIGDTFRLKYNESAINFWNIEVDNYTRFSISRTYNGIKTYYWKFDGSNMSPNVDRGCEIGATNRRLNKLFTYALYGNNNNYGITLPDMSDWTANKEIGLAEGTFNVINASDITNNTLTQAQYDLITNGKPSFIKGTIRNYYSDLFIVSVKDYSASVYLLTCIHDDTISVWSVNKSTKILNLESSSFQDLNLRSISQINGKLIPIYPSSPAAPQYLTYDTDNALKWTGGASGTVLYQHKLVDPNNTNFSIYIISKSSTPITTLTTSLINDALAAYFDYSISSISYKKIATAATEYGIIFLYYYNGTRPVGTTEVSSLNEGATVTDTVTQL